VKKALFVFLVFGITTLVLPSRSYSQLYVGVYIDTILTEGWYYPCGSYTMYGGVSINNISPITGVEYRLYMYGGGSMTVNGSPFSSGGYVVMPPNFNFTITGALNYKLRAVGTPQVSGEVYPCSFDTYSVYCLGPGTPEEKVTDIPDTTGDPCETNSCGWTYIQPEYTDCCPLEWDSCYIHPGTSVQAVGQVFQKTFGDSAIDEGISISATSDGGYLIVGNSDTSAILIKINIDGDTLWTRRFYTGTTTKGKITFETYDGNYIIGGNNNFWGFIIKTNTNGNIVWQRSYSTGSNSQLEINSISQTSDSGLIMAGTAWRWDTTGTYVGRAGSDGQIWAARKLMTSLDYQGFSILQTSNGRYIAFSQSNPYQTGHLLYMGSSLSIFTNRDLGWLSPFSAIETIDGKIVFAGKIYNGSSLDDIFLAKTTVTGGMQWSVIYSGDSNDVAKSVLKTPDGGYIIVGTTYSYGAGNGDVLLIKTDSLGNMQWSKAYGGIEEDIGNSIALTNDGGYIIVGTTKSFGSGNKDIYLVKTDSLGRCACNETDVNIPFQSLGAPTFPSQGYFSGNYSSGNSIYTSNRGTIENTICFAQCTFPISTNSTPILCNGGTSDSATAVPTGGTEPYTYSWSTGDTTQSIYNLIAGSYTVTVLDSNNCSEIVVINITEPPQLTVNITGYNISCYGAGDGVANVSVNGGTPPYTYSWSTGDTTAAITNLAAGWYNVTVHDSCGYSLTDSFLISEPTPLTISTTSPSLICNGNWTTVTANVTGGTAPYTYSWSTGDAGTGWQTIYLPAGSYTVTVVDSNGCTVTDSVVITEPPPINIVSNITRPTCGNSDGSIIVNVQGGVNPYVYFWNNSDTDSIATLTGIPTDTLLLLVTDSNNCSASSTFIVNCIDNSCQAALSLLVSQDSCPGAGTYIYAQSSTTFQRCSANVPTDAAPDGAPCTPDPNACPVTNFIYATVNTQPCFCGTITSSTIQSIYVSLDTVPGTYSHGCGHDVRLWLRSPAGTLYSLAQTKPLNQNTDNKYKPTFTIAGTLGYLPNVNNVSYDGVGYIPDGGSISSQFVGQNMCATNSYATALGFGAGTWILYLSDNDSTGCTDNVRITEFCMTFQGGASGDYSWSSAGCNSYLSDTTSAYALFYPPSGIYDCTYYVTASDSCGCLATDSLRLYCPTPSVVESVEAGSAFNIYPNPAPNSFTVSIKEELRIGNWELKIVDVTGRVVHAQTTRNSKSEIINCNFSSGLYFVKLSAGERVYLQKLLIE
jgi:hypothetical protein